MSLQNKYPKYTFFSFIINKKVTDKHQRLLPIMICKEPSSLKLRERLKYAIRTYYTHNFYK